MPLAYVLIKYELSAESEIFEALLKMKGIEEVNVVYGEFDIIAKVNARNMDELRDIVIKGIRGIRGVESTKTAIVAISSIKYPAEEKLVKSGFLGTTHHT